MSALAKSALFSGHIVLGYGISVDSSTISVEKDWPVLKSMIEV